MIVADNFRSGDPSGGHVRDVVFQPDQSTSPIEGLWSVWCFSGGGRSDREVGLGRVGAGMRCGVQGAGRSRDRPGVRAGGRGGRIVQSCGAGGRVPGRRMAGGAPVSALMP